ncbi:MAG TPA: cell division protein ZipA C-terminal FtsZ-binding domain-containing protein [Woeseiaceae bacterium]|nr:cell division protein ZipA C-terminal FtsZ-binding domain-containing protein [Woeseiaceae bacterium]
MDGLRWLLLLFGLLVIAGVYVYSRREKKPSAEDAQVGDRVEPSLDAADAVDDNPEDDPDAPSFDEDADDDASETLPGDDTPQKIVTVRIVAREKKSFAGDELVLSMRGIGLRHGKFGIFHRYDGNDESRTVFSAASLVEPGSFDLQNIKGQKIPGISLFLVLPGPVECVEAFDLMLAAARALTQTLDGELLDESGSTLSIQRERYLREEIIQFQHSRLVS